MGDANLENVSARIRARAYGSRADRLAQDVAQGLASQTKLASYRRGLAGGVVAGRDGGTTLGVGDNAAAFTSTSLQPPQTGVVAPNGALGVRSQGRVEMERRTLPGVITSSLVTGALYIDLTVVTPYATTPRLGSDSTTGQNTAATPAFDGLLDVSAAAAAGTVSRALLDQAVTITVPLPDGGNPYANGQVIDVTTAKQWDVRTVWANKEGRRVPVVSRALASESHSTPSAAAAAPAPAVACTLRTVGWWPLQGSNSYTADLSSLVAAPGLASPGSYWRLLEYADGSRGSFADAYPWAAAGRVGTDGSLTGLPASYTASGLVPPNASDTISLTLDSGCLSDDGVTIHWYGYHGDPTSHIYGEGAYLVVSPAADWP